MYDIIILYFIAVSRILHKSIYSYHACVTLRDEFNDNCIFIDVSIQHVINIIFFAEKRI